MLIFRKTATISDESSVVENLLDSPVDVSTPRPFHAQGSPTPRPYPEEDSSEILPRYKTPRPSFSENNTDIDAKQPGTVEKKNITCYPLSKTQESLFSAHVRHVITPTLFDPPSQYRHLDNDGVITIHLKIRTSPFSKEEISYPGGPQFSGSGEDDKFVNRIDHMRAVIDWLESQEIFDSLPATNSVDSETDPDC